MRKAKIGYAIADWLRKPMKRSARRPEIKSSLHKKEIDINARKKHAVFGISKKGQSYILKTKDEYEALKFAELSIDEKELILAYRTSQNKEKFLQLLEKKENKKSD